MQFDLELDAYEPELSKMALAQKTTIQDMVEKMVLERLHIFLLGMVEGQENAHAGALEAIDRIGRAI